MKATIILAITMVFSITCFSQETAKKDALYKAHFSRFCMIIDQDTVSNVNESCLVSIEANKITLKGIFNKEFNITQTIFDPVSKVSLLTTDSKWELIVSEGQVKCLSPDKAVTLLFKDPTKKTLSS